MSNLRKSAKVSYADIPCRLAYSSTAKTTNKFSSCHVLLIGYLAPLYFFIININNIIGFFIISSFNKTFFFKLVNKSSDFSFVIIKNSIINGLSYNPTNSIILHFPITFQRAPRRIQRCRNL